MGAAKIDPARESLVGLNGVPADSPEQLSQAASLVKDFAAERTLPSLDALLAAAGQDETAPAARDLIERARTLTAQTQTLFGEVERFLAVSPAARRAGTRT